MFEEVKKLHLKVERFFEQRKKEASLEKALVLLVVSSLFVGFLTQISLSLTRSLFFPVFYLFLIFLVSLVFFVSGKLLGGKGSLLQFVYSFSIYLVLIAVLYYVTVLVSKQLFFFQAIVWLWITGVILLVFYFYLGVVMIKQVHKLSYFKAFLVFLVCHVIISLIQVPLLAFVAYLPLPQVGQSSFQDPFAGRQYSLNGSSKTLRTGANGCPIHLYDGWNIAHEPEIGLLRDFYKVPSFNSSIYFVNYKGPEVLELGKTNKVVFRDLVPSEELNLQACNGFTEQIRSMLSNSTLQESRTDAYYNRSVCIAKFVQAGKYWYYGKGKFDDMSSYVLTYFSKEPVDDHFELIMKEYNCK